MIIGYPLTALTDLQGLLGPAHPTVGGPWDIVSGRLVALALMFAISVVVPGLPKLQHYFYQDTDVYLRGRVLMPHPF